MITKKAAIAIMLMLAFSVVLTSPVQTYAQPADPVSVIQAWVAALDAHDFDAAVDLLDEGAFLIVATESSDELTVYEGKNEIRSALEAYREDNVRIRFAEEPQLEMGTVFWVEQQSSDSLRQLGIASVEVIGEALVPEGKIQSLIYTLTAEAAMQIERARQQAGGPPTGMPRTGIPDLAPYLWSLCVTGMALLVGVALRKRAQAQA